MLYGATRTYHLNTILMRDPRNTTKAQAVHETIELIARTAVEPKDISLTLQDYHQLVDRGP